VIHALGGWQDEGWGVVNRRTQRTTFATREIPRLMAAVARGLVFQAHGRAGCGISGTPCENRTQPCWSPLPVPPPPPPLTRGLAW
jgi:hypothetical protein